MPLWYYMKLAEIYITLSTIKCKFISERTLKPEGKGLGGTPALIGLGEKDTVSESWKIGSCLSGVETRIIWIFSRYVTVGA